MDIGEKIQLLRKEKQMTQNMVAEVLHVSTQAVSNWER
ncbi:MAG: helix-turn-helix domain-containing protein [Enterococcus italicus]